MSNYLLAIPEDIYERASQLAEERHISADQVLLGHLQQFVQSPLEPDLEAELQALHSLSNVVLIKIANERVDNRTNAEMQNLMDKNNFGTLTEAEHTQLEHLVDQSQRLMLRKSEARAILATRNANAT